MSLDDRLSLAEVSKGWLWGSIPGRRTRVSGPLTSSPGLAHRFTLEGVLSPLGSPGLPALSMRTQMGRSLAKLQVSGGKTACSKLPWEGGLSWGSSLVRLPWAWQNLCPSAELNVTPCTSTTTLGFGRSPSLFVLQTPTYSLKLGSLKSQLPKGL